MPHSMVTLLTFVKMFWDEKTERMKLPSDIIWTITSMFSVYIIHKYDEWDQQTTTAYHAYTKFTVSTKSNTHKR